jgi:uncharacterized RDD family membrane protein YckC
VTPGDPLGGDGPERRVAQPIPSPGSSGYGGGPVPPGAFAPRERGDVVNPFAGAEPAEWWRRAVAAILDGLVIAGVSAFVLLVLGGVLSGVFDLDDTSGVAGAIAIGLFVLIGLAVAALVYAPLVMAQSNGKTLGKMATGCRVVRSDGRRIDFLWAAYREVVIKTLALGVAAAITGGIAYLVDYLWPLFDGRKRALHDIVVDSRVVRG